MYLSETTFLPNYSVFPLRQAHRSRRRLGDEGKFASEGLNVTPQLVEAHDAHLTILHARHAILRNAHRLRHLYLS